MVISVGACYLLKRLDWLCQSAQDCLLVITFAGYFWHAITDEPEIQARRDLSFTLRVA